MRVLLVALVALSHNLGKVVMIRRTDMLFKFVFGVVTMFGWPDSLLIRHASWVLSEIRHNDCVCWRI
jgi:hypothetical protein